MDTLERAKKFAAQADIAATFAGTQALAAIAQAEAAIAQAEQLKRIADNLELIVQEWGKPHYTVNPILK